MTAKRRAKDQWYSFTHASQHLPETITVAQSLEELAEWSRIRNASRGTVFEPLEFTQHLASRAGRRVHAFMTGHAELAGYAGMNSAHESDLVASIGVWGGGDWRVPEASKRAHIIAGYLEDWCRITGASGAELSVKSELAGRVDFWESRGWVTVGEHHTLIATPTPCSVEAGPPGMAIVTLAERPELRESIYQIYKSTWIDVDWGDDHDVDVLPFDRWWENIDRWPGSSPETFFIAVVDGTPIGYSELDLGGDLDDHASAYCAYTGVLRPWQGNGVATALKQHTMNWACSHGITALFTGNDEENTAIARVNSRFGFTKHSTAFEMSKNFQASA